MLQEKESLTTSATRTHGTEDAILNTCLLDLQALSHIALIWFRKTQRALPPMEEKDVHRGPHARLAAVQALTNSALRAARGIPALFAQGTTPSAVAAWKLITEAQNDVLFIHMHISSHPATRWNLVAMTKAGDTDPESARSQALRETALAQLQEAYGPNFRLDDKWWALKEDGTTCRSAADLAHYVWANRRSALTQAQRQEEARKEIELLQEAESPQSMDPRLNPFPFLDSTLDSLHDLTTTYKESADFLFQARGQATGQDFTSYPEHMAEPKRLSVLVLNMHQETKYTLQQRYPKAPAGYRGPPAP